MKKGKFIVLYGINNLGKTTQAKLLVKRIKQAGKRAEYLKYPIYHLKPSGQMLNNYLRQGNTYNLTPREAQIIYANNRTQYQPELIKKLVAGINIIAEDYVGTSLAWGAGTGIKETFSVLINSHLLREDLAFLFDGQRFLKGKETNHKYETDEKLIDKVRKINLKLAKEYDWIIINANQTIAKIHEQLWQKINKIIK